MWGEGEITSHHNSQAAPEEERTRAREDEGKEQCSTISSFTTSAVSTFGRKANLHQKELS